MSGYKISLINCDNEETRTKTDLMVLKGIVEPEEQPVQENFNQTSEDPDDTSEEDVEAENEWSNNVKILLNSTTSVPFKSDGKAFTFVVTLDTGSNVIEFLSTDGKDISFKKLYYNYEPPELDAVSNPIRSVIPILIFCRDEAQPDEGVIESTRARVRLGMKICQLFFEEKLLEHGLDRRTFYVSLNVITMRLMSLSINKLNITSAEKIWEKVACQIKASDELWNPLNKYVGFMYSSCRLVTDSLAPKTADRLACGAGGLALIGFNTFSIWPKNADAIMDSVFSDTELVDHPLPEIAMYLGHLENKEGTLYCATMGALVHEMGHMFDLGHSYDGLMGTDFYKFSQFFAPIPILKINCFDCTNVPYFVDYFSRGRSDKKKIAICCTHSSAKILSKHRWFTGAHDVEVSDQRPKMIKNIIFAKFPLHVVEVRDVDNEIVLKSYILKPNTSEIVLSKRDLPLVAGDVGVFVAQDCKGNLMKATVARSDLPNLFTIFSPQGF